MVSKKVVYRRNSPGKAVFEVMEGVFPTHNACYVNFLKITSKNGKSNFSVDFPGKI